MNWEEAKAAAEQGKRIERYIFNAEMRDLDPELFNAISAAMTRAGFENEPSDFVRELLRLASKGAIIFDRVTEASSEQDPVREALRASRDQARAEQIAPGTFFVKDSDLTLSSSDVILKRVEGGTMKQLGSLQEIEEQLAVDMEKVRHAVNYTDPNDLNAGEVKAAKDLQVFYKQDIDNRSRMQDLKRKQLVNNSAYGTWNGTKAQPAPPPDRPAISERPDILMCYEVTCNIAFEPGFRASLRKHMIEEHGWTSKQLEDLGDLG